jgi:hypothetical protein
MSVLLLLAGAGGWSAWQLAQHAAAYGASVSGNARAAVLAQDMRATLLLQVQAVKNTLLRGGDAKQFEAYAAEFYAAAAEARALRAGLAEQEQHLTAEERALLERFDAGWESYLQAWPQAKAAFGGPGGDNAAEADAVIRGKDRDAVAALDQLAASLMVRAASAGARETAAVTQALVVIAVIVIGATLAGIVWPRSSGARRPSERWGGELAQLG